MIEPVRVGDFDYEKENIIKYLKENENIDPYGMAVNMFNKNWMEPSNEALQLICKMANKLKQIDHQEEEQKINPGTKPDTLIISHTYASFPLYVKNYLLE